MLQPSYPPAFHFLPLFIALRLRTGTLYIEPTLDPRSATKAYLSSGVHCTLEKLLFKTTGGNHATWGIKSRFWVFMATVMKLALFCIVYLIDSTRLRRESPLFFSFFVDYVSILHIYITALHRISNSTFSNPSTNPTASPPPCIPCAAYPFLDTRRSAPCFWFAR